MASPNVEGKEIYKIFYVTDSIDCSLHQCKTCAQKCRQKLSAGYANLITHAKSHDGWMENVLEYRRCKEHGRAMDAFVRPITEKAKSIYGWIDWIVDSCLPFAIVKNDRYRKYSNLRPISKNTLKKYFKLLVSYVKEKLAKMIPKTFGLLIDGWTIDGEHFNAIFLTWSSENTRAVYRYLLSCSVAEDVDEKTEFAEGLDADDKTFGFTAADWFDVICSNLVVAPYSIDINIENFNEIVEFITADNCSTNQRLCTLAKVPMLGCDSHRLNLEIAAFVGPEQKKNNRGIIIQEEGMFRTLVNKVDCLMGELKTLKNASLLRTKTYLLPERKNATRWYSLFKMLIKYKKIREFLAAIDSFPPSVTQKIPTAVQNTEIDSLVDALKKFESVSQALQRDGDRMINKMGARSMFNKLIKYFEAREPVAYDCSYIIPDAEIVHSKHFENGIVKIQEGKEQLLTPLEKRSVKIFRICANEEIEGQANEEEVGFADEALHEAESRKKARLSKSEYRSTEHCHSTTDCVERLFSRCKLNMTSLRKKMDPDSLEMLVFLRANKTLWPDARSMQAVFDRLTGDELLQEEEDDNDDEDINEFDL